MFFRQYSDVASTLKEWAKQLTVANKGRYTLYSTAENTLNHWKNELNNNLGVSTFSLSNTPEATINDWENKLNSLYKI